MAKLKNLLNLKEFFEESGGDPEDPDAEASDHLEVTVAGYIDDETHI